MNLVSLETTVGDIVRARPARARLFEKLGIDYCCGGKKPLAEACRSRGLDAATVVAMLTALDAAPETSEADPDAMTLAELCDHIERSHHDYLREELPRLDYLTRKVAVVHGDREPRLREVRKVFENFSEKLSAHTNEEEAEVFPAIRRLEAGAGDARAATATIAAACGKLEAEHEKTGAALARFHELTDGYTPPDWACNTFRALYDSLAHLERDMHQHVHKENNVLFPKARSVP